MNLTIEQVSIAALFAGIMMMTIIIPRTLTTNVTVVLTMLGLVRLLCAGKVLR